MTDFMITLWPSDGCYHVERDGEELPGAYAEFEPALTYAKSIATGDVEIGLTFSEHKYVRGARGGWKRQRVEWIERPPGGPAKKRASL